MTKEDFEKLSQNIKDITNNFEDKAWTGNSRLLKEDFELTSLNNPNHYLNVMDDIEELLRETQLMFIFSVLDKVCIEEGKLYYFTTPYQASMSYDAVVKKEGNFYLRDEDGDFSDLFISSNFAHFIDDTYWEIYEESFDS